MEVTSMAPDTLTQVNTWVEFAYVVWKDVWGYAVSTGIGVVIGLFFPQMKLARKVKE
jgi:hypothetical protein